ncbi:YgaP-like transmembrane domain [Halarcobacter ebronensis]|uniref:Inner membrane protein YgaP-like transmembrane domain-containing protein n=1 Tax=Halarcobacter ebronensis TaxID=1462615 RepID=A0A4Q1AQQ0_9BACT|nr:YgaP-like transmembrane domain [Halarcobacter ebronensis]QKF82339.1 putative membrane protein [Halarcobacter ebronensis]RXK07632.1 hypothetical protein CRV07_03995 [Halarcobacter ebronensis]
MNKYDKIRNFCRKFRIIIGILLIAAGVYTGIFWFYLGVIPLIVGLIDFCPICIFTKKCTPKNL